VNLLEDNVDTIKKSTETLIEASKVGCLEPNVDKTEYMLLSRHQSRSKSGHKNSKQIVSKCVTVQIFGNNSNKSKPDSGIN
jgi:hypothetical protein